MFKTRTVQLIKCKVCADGSNEVSLISGMSSDFVWTSIFFNIQVTETQHC